MSDLCLAESPPQPTMGYLCTLPKGHEGDHRCEQGMWSEERYIGFPDVMANLTPVAPAGKRWESRPNGWVLVDVPDGVGERDA